MLFLAGILLWLLNTANLGMYWVAVSLLAIGIFVWRWFENLASKYELTEERLIIRKGIIAKSVDEIEMYRIKDVRINFSIINQLVGLGTISISSSDETTRNGDLVIRDLEGAQARREQLRRLVDTARQKRRVREIDMVHEDFP